MANQRGIAFKASSSIPEMASLTSLGPWLPLDSVTQLEHAAIFSEERTISFYEFASVMPECGW